MIGEKRMRKRETKKVRKMGERLQRVRVLETRDWQKPSNVALWPAFEAVVVKLLLEWDVLHTAVEGGWSDGDPHFERAKVIDDALANFSQRARIGNAVDAHEVNTFLVETMDERFNADIEFNTATSIAKILVKVYEEVRQGSSTGIRHLLGDDLASFVLSRGEAFDLDAMQLRVNIALPSSQQQLPSTPSTQQEMQMPMHPPQDMQQEQQLQQPPTQTQTQKKNVDDDGWETVGPRRSQRVKNQYTVTPNAWASPATTQQLFQSSQSTEEDMEQDS